MLGLAIHTSSPQLGLMLQSVDGSSVNRHQVWDLGREVSSQLHAKMIEFIAPHDWSEISFVAVAKGPGGFTGTRIGVVAARTLAQQLEIPLFGISSLAALAQLAMEKGMTDSSSKLLYIAATMPAKREAVYGAIFRPERSGNLVVEKEEAVVPQAEWQTTIAQWRADGRAITEVTTEPGAGTADSVRGVMALALTQWKAGARPAWETVMPFYGQHPVRR